ncbi:hypothetical protein [Nitrolancea hollandica]|uniref:Uncharacterized protein n=1 Tax=Nitrolancea hollandica Lb TaxID=1129897 RepID=I4EG40_9BACT|nr:hypothetical protein [Nitrolancea hollandica]CCF83652.1 hypothetical protein NITHO_2520027 [Nitrolancea hollandica Lb]
MAVAVRYLDRFTSADGATVVTFPIELYEWQSKQELRTAFAPIVGGDYAVDLLGGDPAGKQPGAESLSFDVGEDTDGAINTLIDDLKADCHRIGSGKLWTTDAAGNRRWAWARATGMPGYAVNINNELVVPVALEFTRLSDWFGETLQTHTEEIVSTPHTFNLTTQGNAPVQAVVIRFRANGAGGYTNPKLRNKTNGENFTVNRIAAGANDEIRVDTGRWACDVSDDDGMTYTDALPDLVIADRQFNILTLAEGLNQMEFSDEGLPDLVLEVSWHDTFH